MNPFPMSRIFLSRNDARRGYTYLQDAHRAKLYAIDVQFTLADDDGKAHGTVYVIADTIFDVVRTLEGEDDILSWGEPYVEQL